jgi:FlaG/FlaF family flagellin (archaellin)
MREGVVSYRSVCTIAAATSFLLLASVSAYAACKPSAGDTCLIGIWKQTGGGAAEWMHEHMKMAEIKVQATKATITFKANGTFSTSKVDATSQVQAKDSPMQMTGHMAAQGSGQWSAADGKLTLCQAATNAKGTMQLKMPGGKTMNMPIPQMGPSEVTMSYTCAGDTLSTVQQMPMGSPMTTTYARVP